jgi:hypothetical protein
LHQMQVRISIERAPASFKLGQPLVLRAQQVAYLQMQFC